MAKLVVSMFTSLDGVIEEPMWTFPYWSDEIARFKREELFAAGALLLGRVTYAGFAQAWPGRTDAEGYAERINSLPKYVVSSTLDEASWQPATIIRNEAMVATVAELRAQAGQDLLVFGSGRLVQALMAHDLIDEYRLLVYPLVLGKGQPMFLPGSQAKMKLMASQAFDSGVVALTYQPDRTP